MRVRIKFISGRAEVIECDTLSFSRRDQLYISTPDGKNDATATEPLRKEDEERYEMWSYRLMVLGFLDLVDSGYEFRAGKG